MKDMCISSITPMTGTSEIIPRDHREQNKLKTVNLDVGVKKIGKY